MKRLLLFSIVAIYAVASSAVSNKDLYRTLDSLILHHDEIAAQKETHIRSIHDGLVGIPLSSEQIYDLNLRLYDENMAFRFDSAHYYIGKNVEALRGSNDRERFAASAIRMAHILAVTGLFDRSQSLMEEINLDSLSTKSKVEYYTQESELCINHAEMAQYTHYIEDYVRKAQYYRLLAIKMAPKDSYDYIFNLATYTCETGDTEKAIKILESYLLKLQQGTRTFSIVTNTLAYFYQRKNDTKKQEYFLLLSAISDEMGAIYENNSLRQLSELLMERGDNDTAYRYLYQAMSEAQFYGSRLRMMQVGRMAPQVMKLYDSERTETQRLTNIFLILFSLVTVTLIGIIIYTLVLYRKKITAGKQIREMYDKQCQLYDDMNLINMQIKEANMIKEEYIGRFLELSSNLVRRGEEHLKKLNRLAREKKMEELYTDLKSGTYINNGIKEFYKNFDAAFLNIYPNFINEVNKLLLPEGHFSADTEGGDSKKLTTEQRVLALIRLGINDNQKLADILRSSIATIYTYRSKMKAKAINKESFEDDVRKISAYR